MTQTKLAYNVKLDRDLLAALKHTKAQAGIGESTQIRDALRVYFLARGTDVAACAAAAQVERPRSWKRRK